MKKMIAILAVVALTASCFASSITITATATGSAVTIGYSATGGVPVGISMQLSATTGSLSIANRAAVNDAAGTHKVYIDYAYTNGTANLNATTGIDSTGAAHPVALTTGPGAKTLPATLPVALCMGTLGTAPASGTLDVITFTGTGTLHFAADTANRGGIVDATGAAMTVTWPADLPIGAVCKGDSNGDNKVNLADVTAIVGKLSPLTPPTHIPPYTIPSTDPAYKAADDYNSDGKVNLADVTAIVGLLSPLTPPTHIPPYTFTCP